jgi:hypothetical protein
VDAQDQLVDVDPVVAVGVERRAVRQRALPEGDADAQDELVGAHDIVAVAVADPGGAGANRHPCGRHQREPRQEGGRAETVSSHGGDLSPQRDPAVKLHPVRRGFWFVRRRGRRSSRRLAFRHLDPMTTSRS